MSSLVETTSIEIKDLPDAVQDSIAEGIRQNEDERISTVENNANKFDDANNSSQKKEDVQSGGTPTTETTTSTTSSGGE